jgi:hypothetical protein
MALTRTLLANNWISATDALKALDRYAETRIPLGRLAMAEGMLKIGPLLHILDQQLEEASVGEARRFGEIAVELGYLNPIEVAALLEAQAAQQPSFEQILVELGAKDAVIEGLDDAPPSEEGRPPDGKSARERRLKGAGEALAFGCLGDHPA